MSVSSCSGGFGRTRARSGRSSEHVWCWLRPRVCRCGRSLPRLGWISIKSGCGGVVSRPNGWPGWMIDGGPGRPRIYGHDERLKIVETVTATTPEVESQWSHRLIAEALSDVGISASQIGRILADLDLKPHLVRGWLTRPDDPDFAERAIDVCGLYLHRPGDNALVLSVDEKTAIAGPVAGAIRPNGASPAMIERQEFEYRRHGTACLMAALNVHTGEVIATDAERNDADNFIAFLHHIDTATPGRAGRPSRVGQRRQSRRPQDHEHGSPTIPASSSTTPRNTPRG